MSSIQDDLRKGFVVQGKIHPWGICVLPKSMRRRIAEVPDLSLLQVRYFWSPRLAEYKDGGYLARITSSRARVEVCDEEGIVCATIPFWNFIPAQVHPEFIEVRPKGERRRMILLAELGKLIPLRDYMLGGRDLQACLQA
ncbi:MAG TPA: hypothetical protein VF829_00520 [Candidatus Paceibacterota bacterium]